MRPLNDGLTALLREEDLPEFPHAQEVLTFSQNGAGLDRFAPGSSPTSSS